ncbi:PREDICTED: aspartic proteinase-like protein 2 isoform X2 [Camelina sativa]|uniref:Aspartic proteinase-like protein 2 isoform X2 n=1 Tax=Camelina sativa TaxID=90675 RepID=A0ABM0X7K7_CAMSA|nr:PREDICTED: aspartic proteinase-like protein 2 isoform X2 [Camelina sativa]
MDRPSLLLIPLLFITTVISIFVFDLTTADELDLTAESPMIFPLSYSSLPPRVEDIRRRRLHQSQLPNAHMKLYDDLLSNGYYTTRLWIGTPPQEFALIVDTGSTVTYVPCSTCKQCGKHQDPKFQPELSSSYQALKCNPDCNCDDEGKLCVYERRYAEMSSSSGVLSEDLISFGNESQLSPQRAVFGCENVETGDLFSQRADGIMGLGRGKLSVVDQLVDKGVIEDTFSLCYGGMEVGGGAMVLGKIYPPAGMVFSHSDPFRSPYYNIDLKQMHVAGKSLKLNPKVFNGKHGTVLDSGTTYAYFPKEAFIAIKAAVIKEIPSLKRIHGPDPNYDDVCFSGAGRDVAEIHNFFPEIAMEFGNGQNLILSPENYLFRHTKVRGAYCLGIFPDRDSTTLLGGIVVRNTLVTYDRENDKLGFLKTNCSDLWRRLAAPDSPAPTSPVSQNKTSSISPSPATSESSTTDLPGVFRVGVITFEVSISVNNSSQKPEFSEMADFIAHELDIKSSQVHLLNISSRGNEYRLKWGIFPAQSSEYISNTTALNIMLLLKENRLRLPGQFGSYKLLEWKAEQKQKQSWWETHVLGVVAGVVISLLVTSVMIKLVLVWRRRKQEEATYEPVSAAVKEQELQPLSSDTSNA